MLGLASIYVVVNYYFRELKLNSHNILMAMINGLNVAILTVFLFVYTFFYAVDTRFIRK